MSYFKFGQNDIFHNTIEANPEYNYYIHSGTIYLDYLQEISGAYSDNITGVPKGFVSLYEYNINRVSSQRIYPFITKGGIRSTLKSVTDQEWNTTYGYGGEQIRGNYNLSASITRFAITSNTRPKITALKNVLDHYAIKSPHYQYSSSFGDKSLQDISLINIPSILYGSSIEKGSMSLKFYVSGTVVGELQDTRHNGELVQVAPYGSTGSGSVGGVVLYNEGLILLTGSWELDDVSRTYDGSSDKAKWKYFGMGANDGATIDNTNLSSSFSIDYKGVNKIQTINMFCHAKNGELNFSNNPTYLSGTPTYTSGSKIFKINQRDIKNTVSSSYHDVTPDFKKTTYISKIAIYDENKNLIGIAKVATPVRKTEEKQFTFKLKLDI
tara:strand:- start:1321 stop:2466 length:1146 start_codon:yes stop_codon:yes gene_type:complete